MIKRSWDTSYHDKVGNEHESVQVSRPNRDTTPPSGRAPSLEGPRGDEVDLFTSLTLYATHSLGTLQALAAPMHLGVYVSDTVFQPLYLLQLAMQFFLQLAVSMHFGTEAVVSEAD
jgi:hypothetical protein